MFGASKESNNMTLLSSVKKKANKVPKDATLPDGTNNYFPLFNPIPSNSEYELFSTRDSSIFSDENLSDKTGAVRKRTQSKISYGQRKKSKIKDSVQTTDDDKNIDNDLFALVKTIEPNEHSDSSRDTIILNDLESERMSPIHSEKDSFGIAPSFQSNTYLCSNLFSTPIKPLDRNNSADLLSSTSDPINYSKCQGIEANLTSKSMAERKPRKTTPVPFMYDSTIPKSSILLNMNQKLNSMFFPKSEKPANPRSIYAEMGLDEDLCDVKATNFDSKLHHNPSVGGLCDTNKSLSTPLVSDLVNIPIKKERESPEPQGKFLSNDMHISMTFEADPYDMDDDDLPLSFLKGRSTTEESSSEANSQNKTSNDYPPVFIKKELIDEDEIEFATNCTSDLKNKEMLNASSVTNNDPLVNVHATKSNDLSSKFLQLPVRIKTEPNTENSSKTLQNSTSSGNLNHFTTTEPATTVKSITKKGSKRQNTSIKGKKKSSKGKGRNMFVADVPNLNNLPGNAFQMADTAGKLSLSNNPNDCDSFGTVPKLSISLKMNSNLFNSPDFDLKVSDKSSKTDDNSLKTSNSEENVVNSIIGKRTKAKKSGKHNKINVEMNTNLDTSSEVYNDALEAQKPDNEQINVSSSTDNIPVIKKKKIGKKETDLDENVPITLLIKKQQTGSNENESESFLCTSLNKPVVPEEQPVSGNSFSPKNYESCSNSVDSAENFELAQIKDFLRKSVDSSELETCGLQTESPKKKKTGSKKKSSKNKDKKATEENKVNIAKASSVGESTSSVSEIKKNQLLNPNPEVPFTVGVSKESAKMLSEEKNEDTVVLMSFEEQDSPDASENYLENISIKKECNVDLPCGDVSVFQEKCIVPSAILTNIKKEPDFDSHNEPQGNSPLKSNSVPFDVSLGNSSSNLVSNETINPILPNQPVSENISQDLANTIPKTTPTKKKKRRGRSTAWYKKKKVRKITKTSSDVSSASEIISDLELNVNNSINVTQVANLNNNKDETNALLTLKTNEELISQMKNPVVYVKNFALNVQKTTASQINETQAECTKGQNLAPGSTDNTAITQIKETKEYKLSAEPTNLMPASENSILNETDNVLANSATAQRAKVSSPRKGKRRRRGSNKSRAKRSQNKLVTAESVSCATCIDPAVVSEFALSESNTFEKTVTLDVNLKSEEVSARENIHCAKNTEVFTIKDSPVKISDSNCTQGRLSPSLNTNCIDPAVVSEFALSEANTFEKTGALNVNLKSGEVPARENIHSDKNTEVFTIKDSPVKISSDSNSRQGRRLLSPSLNVASLEKEIEGLESYALAKRFAMPSLHGKNQSVKSTVRTNGKPVTSVLSSPGLEDTSGKADDSSIFSSSFIQVKKEKDSEYNYLTSSVVNFPCTFSQNATESNQISTLSNISTAQYLNAKKPVFDSSINAEGPDSSNKMQTDSVKSSASDLCKSTEHLIIETADNDILALSIKKEACNMTGKSNCLPPLTNIKNMNDLIEKSDIISGSLIEKPSTLSNSNSKNLSREPESKNISTSTLSNSNSKNLSREPESKNISTSNESEDEIQVIETVDLKTKDVPCVDLTDDNLPDVITVNKENLDLMNNRSQVLSSVDDQVKENVNCNLEEKNKDDSHLNCESNDLLAHIMDEDIASSNERETIDLATLREKYRNEYFKYSFPPSVLFSFKPRNNKMYSRMTSQTLNLSVETVESRLKTEDNIKNQFGNKLGDIVKLEKYPISRSEVACYHRILGVAPSHKLLSKCYKSTEKITTTDVLNLYRTAENAENSSNLQDKPCFMNITLMDIIQAIAENSMGSNTFNFHEGTQKSSSDYMSTDTEGSFKSHGIGDKFTHLQPTNLNSISTLLAGNVDQVAMQLEDNSINKFEKLNLQTSNENDLMAVDSKLLSLEIQNCKQSDMENVPNTVELSSNEVLNNMPKSSEIEHVERENTLYSDCIQEPPANAKCSSLSNEQNVTPDLANSTNEPPNTTAPIFDIDVATLRKIVEVAGTLPAENNLWKNKTTFEYNHTQSVPTMQTHSKQTDESIDTIDTHNEAYSSETPVRKENAKHQGSDDDDSYVDNEPVNEESDTCNHEISDSTEKDEDEPKVPQYKSKWEKIMERKALENKETKQVNEHLLKDCFPVSSKVSSKKMNTCKESDKPKHKSEIPKKRKKDSGAHIKHNSKSESAKIKHPVEASKTKGAKGKIAEPKIKAKVQDKASKFKKKADIVNESNELFAPDKLIKSSEDKKSSGKKAVDNEDSKSKSNDKNSKKFYGNRITNRGTFLTQTSDYLKNIKIPKKKNIPVSKKAANARSEEYHSLVNLPDIDFQDRHVSRYKISNRSSENYNKRNRTYNIEVSPGSNASYSPPHLGNKRMRSPESCSRNFQTYGNNTYNKNESYDLYHRKESTKTGLINQNEKVPLLKSPFLLKSPSFPPNDDIMSNRHVPLNISAPRHRNDEIMHIVDSCHLNTHHSSIIPQNDNTYSCEQSPVGIAHSSTSDYSAVDPYSERNTMAYLQNIIQSVKDSSSSPSMNSGNLPFSDKLDCIRKMNLPSCFNLPYNESMNFNAASAVSINSSSSSSVFSTAISTSSYYVQNPHLKQSPTNYSQERQNHSFASPISMDPTFSPPASMNKPPPQGVSTCLVPGHLKSLVGKQTIETSDVQLLMLEWSVDWLMQQQKFHDPPPISTSLTDVVSSYKSFEDHYNTYVPLMLLDTWHRIYVSWTHLSQATPYFCDITSYSVKNSHVSVECQTVFNTSAHAKGIFPDEGSILMIKYGTKLKDLAIKIFGYVTHVKTRRFNPVTDSKLGIFKPPKDGNMEALQVLTLCFMGAYNSEDIDKHMPVRIHVLCNVKPTLKQHDALLYTKKSPLLNSILNPVAGGLISVALTPRNSSQEDVSDCVRSITKGILSPHPLPLLTIVRAAPESDRLNIIPLIIEKMKTVYKTKVLLCVRTVRALGDIAANICLHESLKLVIINKRGDTSHQFQKYLLDELVAAERVSVDVSKETLHAKNEAIIRTKKQIFQNCDVILSLIRNCHDEFMETTFVENENVAQMCCIVDEANLCTEPETLIPILHGISKLILIGDPAYPAKVLSKTASTHHYGHSFFHRAYDLDLNTE